MNNFRPLAPQMICESSLSSLAYPLGAVRAHAAKESNIGLHSSIDRMTLEGIDERKAVVRCGRNFEHHHPAHQTFRADMTPNDLHRNDCDQAINTLCDGIRSLR